MEDYGSKDGEALQLVISLFSECRKQGIGTALIKEMIGYLNSKHYKQGSLSVDKINYAVE